MSYKASGIIIKKQDWGEFDRLLTVYTSDFGKILVKARSVRKNESKLRGHLDLFLHVHLRLAPAKGFDIVTGAETIESFPYLRQNLKPLTAAHYFSELLDKLIPAPEADKNIWSLAHGSFKQLNQENTDFSPVVRGFENKLADFLGYGSRPEDFTTLINDSIGNQLNSREMLAEVLE